MNNFYVYCYFDPSQNEPIYIGKGHGSRAYDHLKANENNPRCNKHFIRRLKKMVNQNVEPQITFLVENVSEQDAFNFERETIKNCGRRDLGTGPLLNLTDGGEGPSGAIRSVETRMKISESNKGRKHTQEALDKIAKASRRPMSQEQKDKLSAIHSGKTFSSDARAKMSAAKLGKQHLHDMVTCPHCGKFGNKPSLTRWHFDKCKLRGISPSESLITVENGFQPDKIHLLDRGTSPHLAIEYLDSKYPDKE